MNRTTPVALSLALLAQGCMHLTPGASTQPPPEPPPSTTPASAAAAIDSVIRLTNRQRTNAGLSALSENARLAQAAQIHADQMVRAGKLSHTLSDANYPTLKDRLAAAGYKWRNTGENIAYGDLTAANVVTGWMNSPGHRANILATEFTEVGIGRAIDRTGRYYYVQVFGRQANW